MAHETTMSYNDGTIDALIVSADTDVHDTAKQVLAFAHAVVPYDTGALDESLAIERRGVGSYAVGSDLRYAAPVELGHHTHSGSFVPAQPYLRPALDAARAL